MVWTKIIFFLKKNENSVFRINKKVQLGLQMCSQVVGCSASAFCPLKVNLGKLHRSPSRFGKNTSSATVSV